MKVKHIITTCGIILGGAAFTCGAGAVVSYKSDSNVQFTWSGSLSLTLTGDDFEIASLAPGGRDLSNSVVAAVSTNSPKGYTLSATVGGTIGSTTYSTTALESDESTIAMIGSSATDLTAGTWGYTLNGSEATPTFGALDTATSTVLKQTTASGDGSVTMQIGAYAAANQLPGTYHNVINFEATANVATRTITLEKGDGVASVTLGTSGVSGDYSEGSPVNIAATCASGYTFNHWYNPTDYGVIASDTTASTTYTVGAGDVTLTAYCQAN